MRKRILSFVLVFALILSVSVAAYASDDLYTYTVTKTGTVSNSRTVSHYPVVHTQGTVSTINCTIGETHNFNFNQFDSAYRVGLTNAYHDAGLRDSLTVPTYSTWTIPATVAGGIYTLVLTVNFAKGTWSVKYGSNQGPYGNFSNSPVSYSINLSR